MSDLMPGVDAMQSKNAQGIGSVKAAINLFGEMAQRAKPENNKAQDEPTKTRELHLATMDNGQLTAIKSFADNNKALEESELSRARNVVKQLVFQIEEPKANTKTMRLELQSLTTTEGSIEESRYVELMQELDKSKQEIRRLNLAMASCMESKSKADKEFEAWSSKVKSYMHLTEELTKEIDEANEEHVLVELARLEAAKELQEVEAQRKNEADNFDKSIKETTNRIEELRSEIEHAKELETKLTLTNSHVKMLQNELELVRAMEKTYQIHVAKSTSMIKEDDCKATFLLESAEAEVRAAKQELTSIKEDSFQLMTSMDQTRQELIPIVEETSHLKKLEKKVESKIQHLNSKLSKAKSKLEAATVADGRAKAIISNLATTLQQPEMERDTAKREEELITEETRSTIAEIEKADSRISLAQKKLRGAAQELIAVKVSEAMALKKLRKVAERIMKARASVSYRSSIVISKSEYTYLSQQAAAAKVVEKKKVAAAQAWVEALVVGEKEITTKAELIEQEIRKLKAEAAKETYQTQNSSSPQKSKEEDLCTLRLNDEEKDIANLQLVLPKQRRSIRRLSSISGIRYARSPSFTIKKRTQVMPNLIKFLSHRRNQKQT